MSNISDIEMVEYWRDLFAEKGEQGVIDALKVIEPRFYSANCHAMRVAFDENARELATYIDQRWHLQIGMSIINLCTAAVIRYMNGEDAFWVELVLANNGHADRSPMAPCLEAVASAIKSEKPLDMDKVEALFELSALHGDRTNQEDDDGGNINVLAAATDIYSMLRGDYEVHKERWRTLLGKIGGRSNQLAGFERLEKDLKGSIELADPKKIFSAAQAASTIPQRDRYFSPYAALVSTYKELEDPRFSIEECLAALDSGGLSIQDCQPNGDPPLCSVMMSTSLPAHFVRAAVSFLFERGVSADAPFQTTLRMPGSNFEKAFHFAAYSQAHCADMFAAHGNLDVIGGNGMTPLLYAARERNYDMIESLLDLGVDTSIKNNDYKTVLHELFESSLAEYLDLEVDLLRTAKIATQIRDAGNIHREDEVAAFKCMAGFISSASRSEACISLLRLLEKDGWDIPFGEMSGELTPKARFDVHGVIETGAARQKAQREADFLGVKTPQAPQGHHRRRSL